MSISVGEIAIRDNKRSCTVKQRDRGVTQRDRGVTQRDRGVTQRNLRLLAAFKGVLLV